MDFDNCDDGVDIDLYADVNDTDLTSGFSERDLFDDVITGTQTQAEESESDVNLQKVDFESESKGFLKGNIHHEPEPKLKNTLRVLLIGNLSWWTTDADLKKACEEVGVTDVVDIKIVDNRANGQSKGYCHLQVETFESKNTLLSKLKCKELHGLPLHVISYTKEGVVLMESKCKVRPSPVGASTNFIPHNNYIRGPLRAPVHNMPPVVNNYRQPNNCGPRFLPRGPGSLNRNESYSFQNHFPRAPMLRPPPGPPPPMQSGPPSNMGIIRHHGPPLPAPPCFQGPESFPRGPRGMMPHGSSQPPNCDWLQSRMPFNNLSYQGMQNSQSYAPSGSSGHLNVEARFPGNAHVNPAFFSPPGPPGVNSPNNSPTSSCSPCSVPPQQTCDKNSVGCADDGLEHHSRKSGQSFSYGCSPAEYEEIMSRNRTVSSSAISRAVADATAGEFASAIETLVTAISLIKQSRVARDDMCQVIINSLQDTLHGIESRSYGDGRRSSRKDRERSERKPRSRERKSRSRERKSRSRSRDRSRRPSSISGSYHRFRRSSAERENYHHDRHYGSRERERELVDNSYYHAH